MCTLQDSPVHQYINNTSAAFWFGLSYEQQQMVIKELGLPNLVCRSPNANTAAGPQVCVCVVCVAACMHVCVCVYVCVTQTRGFSLPASCSRPSTNKPTTPQTSPLIHPPPTLHNPTGVGTSFVITVVAGAGLADVLAIPQALGRACT
jgi:hypothetical protein